MTSKGLSTAVSVALFLLVTACGGSATDNTGGGIAAPVISSFTATPSTVTSGGSSTLAWTVTGATNLSIDQNVGVVAGASKTITPTSTKTYTLTATNSAGSATRTAIVTVTPTGSVPVIASFLATPASIQAGQSSTLLWSVTGATSVSIDQGVGVVTGASTSVSPPTTTLYTLTATNAAGSATQTAIVTVTPAGSVPVIASFLATPASIQAGQSSTLSWSVTGATSVSIDQGVGVVTGASTSVSPPTTTLYTLTATNATGSVTRATSVTVTPAPTASALRLLSQPANASAGAILAPIRVQIVDATGQPYTSGTVTVTLALEGGGALVGTKTLATLGGEVAFTNLTVQTAGAGQRLISSANGLTSASSDAFSVSAGPLNPPTSDLVLSPNPIVAGQASTVTVTLRDAFGNPLAGLPVTLAATGSGATLVQPGLTGSSGGTSGTVTPTVSGTTTIGATSGSTSLGSQSLTVTPGAPSPGHCALTASPASAPANGTPLALTATLRDSFGNGVASGLGVVFAASGGAVVAGASTQTGPGGVAMASVSSTVVGPQTVTVSVGGTVVIGTAVVFRDPTATFTVGGTITGLEGSGLTLSSPGQAPVVVPPGATSFTFATRQFDGSSYGVTVLQEPSGPAQACLVGNGSGSVPGAPITDIIVTCRSAWWKVAGGNSISFGIRPDGTLWSWGGGAFTQGIGVTAWVNDPVPLFVGSGFASVSKSSGSGLGDFVLAIKTDGSLWAWGGDGMGGIIVPIQPPIYSGGSSRPVQVGSSYASVSAGANYVLGVKLDGTLWAWGDNTYGQLGNGSNVRQAVPVLVGSGFAMAAADLYFAVGLKTDGTLWAWGILDGLFGLGSYARSNVPIQVGSGFRFVTAGVAHVLAIKTDGTLWDWGFNHGNPAGGDGRSLGTGFKAASANDWHSVAVKEDGTLWAWGSGELGELGNGHRYPTNSWGTDPVQIGSGFVEVGLGHGHSMGVKADGTLWSWGGNLAGELGDGTTIYRRGFAQVASGIASIGPGHQHSVAVTASGAFWGAGNNDNGLLGDGTTAQRNVPVVHGAGYAAVASGPTHTLAVKVDGSLWSWGENTYGQLADGGSMRSVPAQVGTGYAQVAVGRFHSMGLKLDGTLWAWGSESYGALGAPGVVRQVPTQVGTDYALVAAAESHTIAIRKDGTLWAWGRNDKGQLGDGTYTNRTTPVLIGSGYARVATAIGHTVALKTDGTLWAWGDNTYGTVGDGTTTPRLTPVQIGSGFSTVAAGEIHSLALKADGTLWGWGHRGNGQLGSGDQGVVALTPVQIDSGFTEISAGQYHSLALKADGTLWATGDDYYGQLGDGGGNKSIPAPIP